MQKQDIQCSFQFFVISLRYNLNLSMGNKESLTCVSLNYSAIIYSPFEFYAMEDWRSMQKLGIIFEENLRKHTYYGDKFLEKEHAKQAPKKQYIRKNYKWTISTLDKHLKRKRYSPLYLDWNNKVKDERERYLPGFQTEFLNYDQFEQFWLKRWKILAQKKRDVLIANKINKITEKDSNEEKEKKEKEYKQLIESCTLFDYLAYRSIIEFLSAEVPNFNSNQFSKFSIKHKDYAFSKLLQEINSQRTIQPQKQNKIVMKEKYQQFLEKSFERIDDDRKQKITKNRLLMNSSIDIINLQQANKNICEILKLSQDFYLFGDLQDAFEDQCLTLVRKNLPFIPQGYEQIYRLQKRDLRDLKEKLSTIPSQNKDIDKYWKRLEQILTPVLLQRVTDKLKQILLGGEEKKPIQVVDLKYQAMGYISNPCKIFLDKYLKKYQQFFLAKHKKQKYEDEIQEQFLEQIKVRGLLCWSQSFTLITFQAKNSVDLGEHLVGNFHLTSNQSKNKLQVQILGFLIYELLDKNIKFIIAGDFNSHIMLKSKDDKASMFDDLHAYLEAHDKKQLGQFQQSREKIHIYPKHKNILTTKKKRTIMQVQVNKSNELIEKCIDQIITNYDIDETQCYTGEITDIGSNTNNNKSFLPNANHPYDHFLVQAKIKLPHP